MENDDLKKVKKKTGKEYVYPKKKINIKKKHAIHFIFSGN